MKKYIPLKRKLQFFIFLTLTLFYIPVSIILKNFMYKNYLNELKEKAVSITENNSQNVAQFILKGDIIELYKYITNIKNSDKDIFYILIVDRDYLPLVHTFEKDVSYPIISKIKNSSDGPQIIKIDGNQGIWNVKYPIMGGLLGSLNIGFSEYRIMNKLRNFSKEILIIYLLFLVFLETILYFILPKYLSPLKYLTEKLKDFGDGKLNGEIEIKSNDEIGLLAQTFNEMVVKLKRTNEELKRAQNIILKTTKIKTIENFARGIAHEINNPLAGVLNCIRTLLGNPEVKGQVRGYIELSLKGLLRIENIIKNMTLPSEILKSEPVLFKINEIIEEAITFVQHKMNEKNIDLEKKLDPFIEKTYGYPECIFQAFLNILNNSIEAIDKNGKIEIITKRKEDGIEINFIDNGKGIKKENIDRIFEPFFTTKEDGKGMGLYLTYNYIQIHNGFIDIESEEGKGTKVSIFLPTKNGNK